MHAVGDGVAANVDSVQRPLPDWGAYRASAKTQLYSAARRPRRCPSCAASPSRHKPWSRGPRPQVAGLKGPGYKTTIERSLGDVDGALDSIETQLTDASSIKALASSTATSTTCSSGYDLPWEATFQS